MSEIAERLRPEIESKVANYLRSIKPIDALYSAGQIKLAVEGNPSDEGYHLDYASLSVGRYGHTAKGGLHRVTTVMWEMPFRIMKNNFKGTHSPDKKITGIIQEMVFRVEFDQNSGDPKIVDLEEFSSSTPRVQNRY